jgi:hypothetical protein
VVDRCHHGNPQPRRNRHRRRHLSHGRWRDSLGHERGNPVFLYEPDTEVLKVRFHGSRPEEAVARTQGALRRGQLRFATAPAGAYVYRDYGSLVSVGSQTSVGTLMGSPKGRSWFVRGGIARLMYVSLHLLHHRAVLGWVRTCGLAVARALVRRNTALVKLH